MGGQKYNQANKGNSFSIDNHDGKTANGRQLAHLVLYLDLPNMDLPANANWPANPGNQIAFRHAF